MWLIIPSNDKHMKYGYVKHSWVPIKYLKKLMVDAYDYSINLVKDRDQICNGLTITKSISVKKKSVKKKSAKRNNTVGLSKKKMVNRNK